MSHSRNPVRRNMYYDSDIKTKLEDIRDSVNSIKHDLDSISDLVDNLAEERDAYKSWAEKEAESYDNISDDESEVTTLQNTNVELENKIDSLKEEIEKLNNQLLL